MGRAMSRPRKPFGATHPGRLPATMMKVLAAEMSDPQRLRRGKQYAHDGSVLDIVIEPGIVTCEVQGSRSTPYIAQVEVTAGDGMPLRRDIRTRCTCPDDDNGDDRACKHVVAAMFAMSDELLLEPELLDVWRQRTVSTASHTTASDTLAGDTAAGDEPAGPAPRGYEPTRRGHLTLVHSDASPPRGTPRTTPRSTLRGAPTVDDVSPGVAASRPHVDPLAEYLHIPDGAGLPDVPVLDRVELPLPKRPDLAALIGDALRHVRVDWD